MTNFSKKTLEMMPSNALMGLTNSLSIEKKKKSSDLASKNGKIAKMQGTNTLQTPVSGKVSVTNTAQKNSEANREGQIAGAVSFANGAAAMTSDAMNPGGESVFVPGTTSEPYSNSDVKTATSELDSYFGTDDPNVSPSTNVAIATAQNESALLQNEIDEISDTQTSITSVLERRATGELLEPVLNLSALDTEEVSPLAKEQIEKFIRQNQEFIQNKIVAPFVENQNLIRTLVAQLSGTTEEVPRFDLEFGPPISSKGKFVLSNDGLYYNSRGGEVPEVYPFPTSAGMWSLQYESNRGGRGLSFTEEDAIDTVDTIFDLDVAVGSPENQRIQDFYEYDDVLQQFEDDRQSHLIEVSGYISELTKNGYAASDAIVQTYNAQLGATANIYNVKIRKRKRQLEIAAIYGGDRFFVTDRDHFVGEGLFFEYKPPAGKQSEYNLKYDELSNEQKTRIINLEGGEQVSYNLATNEVINTPNADNIIAVGGVWNEIPRIPVNDFSYLKETDISLPLQRNLTLFSEDLEGVVAPYQPRYVVAPNKPENVIGALEVESIGFGDWVHRETSGSLSATQPLVKSLTSDIISNDLLLCYNFLDPEAVTQPSGSLYALNNAAEGSVRFDGKLVAYSETFLFPSGVAIPYFGGTIFNERAKQDVTWDDVKGSYARLPNSSREYQTYRTYYRGLQELENLFYSPKGASIDFWAYVPNIHSDMTDHHRYRLVFANENSSPVDAKYVNATPFRREGTNLRRTLGMIVGWRDRGSPEETGSYGSSGLEFVIAPTVGQNQKETTGANKSWGHSICIAEQWSGSKADKKSPAGNVNAPTSGTVSQMGVFIPSGYQTAAGSGIADASGQFVHMNLSFDKGNDQVRVYFDGQLLSTSSYEATFGGIVLPTAVRMNRPDPDPTLQTLTFCDPTQESFLGVNIYDERVSPERVAFPVFTPWIIGGGYSDNIPKIAGTTFRPQGFLGSNTNHTHQGTIPNQTVATTTIGTSEFIIGQHEPPLSGSRGGTDSDRNSIPRSGLDGHLGSFKIYTRPLTTDEVKRNYDSQSGFFKNILLSS